MFLFQLSVGYVYFLMPEHGHFALFRFAFVVKGAISFKVFFAQNLCRPGLSFFFVGLMGVTLMCRLENYQFAIFVAHIN